MRNRPLQLIILLVILAGVGFVIYQNVTSSINPVSKGKISPDFTLRDLEGVEHSLIDYRGKGVILNFWASYCGPCRTEMPALQSQYEKYRDHGIVILGINTGENEITAGGFVKTVDVDFPILMDKHFAVVKAYQVGPIPHTLFIAPDGKVNEIVVGEMNEQTIERNIVQILPRD